jgi:hypothetical protein
MDKLVIPMAAATSFTFHHLGYHLLHNLGHVGENG